MEKECKNCDKFDVCKIVSDTFETLGRHNNFFLSENIEKLYEGVAQSVARNCFYYKPEIQEEEEDERAESNRTEEGTGSEGTGSDVGSPSESGAESKGTGQEGGAGKEGSSGEPEKSEGDAEED